VSGEGNPLRRVVPGTAARRYALETELRELARKLLELDPGAVATGPTAFTDLETALDHLSTLVADGQR
jgi:hypothetical protein